MKKFPNLNKFSLRSTADNQYYYSQDVMMEFFKYVMKKRSFVDRIPVDKVYDFLNSFMEATECTSNVTIANKYERDVESLDPRIGLDCRSTTTPDIRLTCAKLDSDVAVVPPYKVWMDKSANFIHNLNIQDFPEPTRYFETTEISDKEDYLTCILRDGTSLKTLQLQKSNINTFIRNPASVTNTSIETVIISNVDFPPSDFTKKLSKTLPSLKNLFLGCGRNRKWFYNEDQPGRVHTVTMPHTCLDTLCFKSNGCLFMLKLQVNGGEMQYYASGGYDHKFRESSLKEHKETLDWQDHCFVVLAIVKSIKTLQYIDEEGKQTQIQLSNE